METFKLSKDARMAFKHRIENKLIVDNEESLTYKVKEEIKSETETNSQVGIEPYMDRIKQEDIKMELTFEFDPDPKHDITSLISETENKRPVSRNIIETKYSGLNFSTKACPLKPKSVHKKYTRQRRKPTLATAINVHQYLSSKDPNSLTQKQLDSLTWAETFITGHTLRRITNSPTPIEIPDDNNCNELNEAFIGDQTIHLIPDTYQLAIVDFANPGGRYSLANARLIEKTLSKAVIRYILENPAAKHPIFGKSVYFDGVLVLDCKDEVSYEFAKLILWDIKLWDGSKLKIMQPQETPFDSIGSLHTPDVGIEKNKVLDVLKAQNPSVNMSNWKILGETHFKDGYRQYSIKICNPPVYFQRHKQLRLYFGGSEVILKLFGCKWLWNCKV